MPTGWGWTKARFQGWGKHSKTHRSPWLLFKASLQDYRANWSLITGATLIVGLPVAILSSYNTNSSGDTTGSAYLAFMQLAMNVAVIYIAVKLVAGQRTTIRAAYYEGSAMLIRLVLVSVLLVLMMLPLVLGVIIIGIGVLAPTAGLNLPEQLLLTVLAILVATPSVILVTRGLWAVYRIFEGPEGPIQAVRYSRQLTKGSVLVSLGRLLALAGFLVVILLIPVVILVAAGDLTHWGAWGIVLQILITLTVLPLGNLYLYRYYLELV
jgi:hypothetical protein